jgi:hypothetical protein
MEIICVDLRMVHLLNQMIRQHLLTRNKDGILIVHKILIVRRVVIMAMGLIVRLIPVLIKVIVTMENKPARQKWPHKLTLQMQLKL